MSYSTEEGRIRMVEKVSFTSMEHGTRGDYELVARHDRENAARLADRVLRWLREMDGDSPYRISRLEHCLQTATRAERDGADDETVVCALLHDIGDVLAPNNHSAVAADLLAPFIGESMARSSVTMHCQKLGINGDAVSDEQLAQLIEQLGLAMRVFVGADKADALAADIRAALDAGGAS